MNINQVWLAGNLVHDPEMRYLPNGTGLCEISLAVNEVYKGKDGETKKDTAYYEVVLWSKLAEIATQYLKKGQLVAIIGKLKTDHWEDKQTGQKRSKIKIQAVSLQMGPKKEDGTIRAPRPASRPVKNAPDPDLDAEPDEIPF